MKIIKNKHSKAKFDPVQSVNRNVGTASGSNDDTSYFLFCENKD